MDFIVYLYLILSEETLRRLFLLLGRLFEILHIWHISLTPSFCLPRQSRWDLGTSSTWDRAVPAPLAPVKMPQIQQFPQLHCEETWGKHLMKSQQFQQNRRNLVSNFEVQEFCWHILFICFAFSQNETWGFMPGFCDPWFFVQKIPDFA